MFSNQARAHAGRIAAASALSVGLLAGTAGIASAAPTTYTKTHQISASFAFNVHQNNLFHKADASSTRHRDRTIAAGTPNASQSVVAESTAADDTYGSDNLIITEKDASGTLHVRDRQGLLFFWHGSGVVSEVAVDVAPNSTRSFWIYTDGAGGDYVHTLVTITNAVS